MKHIKMNNDLNLTIRVLNKLNNVLKIYILGLLLN